MSVRLRRTFAFAGMLILAGCAGRVAEKDVRAVPPVRITLLGLSDFHGAIEERTVVLKTSGGTTAEVRVGGGSLVASYVRRLRDLNPGGTVVLNGGDMWQGSLESNCFEGRPVVMLDNAIGFDATAVGNHEFDYGPVGPVALSAATDAPEVRYGALLARRAEARFPFLSANTRALEAGVPSFAPSVIVERKGVKIGVIGLSTEDTPNTTQSANIVGMAFDPPAPALIRAAADLRARGVDAVVVAAHIGGECKRGSAVDDPAACDANQEVMRLLAAIPPGTIDAFVAGHTHQYMANVVSGVPVIQSGAYGVAIGRIELEVDASSHKVVASHVFPTQPVCRDVLADTASCAPPDAGAAPRPKVEPATFLGGPILPDAEVERMLAPFRQEVAVMKAVVIGVAERPVTAARTEASEIGVLVCDEMRAATKRLPDVPDADFAIQNSGGLRGPGLPRGPITYGQLYEVLPFDNVLVTFRATGEQLEGMFTAVTRTGRVFQTSGLTVEIVGDGGTASARLYDLATGKRLLATKTYTVVWNDFLASGGDGTRGSLPGVVRAVHSKYVLREVVAEGLRARKGPVNSARDPLLDPKKVRLRRVK